MRLRILNFNIIFSEFISGIYNLPTKYFWHHARDDNLVRVMLRNANSRFRGKAHRVDSGSIARNHELTLTI
jgi:hypothetical protein